MEKIDQDGKSKKIPSGDLMDCALCPIGYEPGRTHLGIFFNDAEPCFDVLDVLLEQGANPHEIVCGKTVWQHFLSSLEKKQGLREDNPTALIPWAETARLFVTQLLAHDRLPASAVGWVKHLQLFRDVFPSEIALEIENMVSYEQSMHTNPAEPILEVKKSLRQRIFRRVVRSGVWDVVSLPRSRSSRMKPYEPEIV